MKPPRICLWIDRFEYYAYGNSSLRNAYLSFRRWGGNPNDAGEEKRRSQERVGWVTRIEKQARGPPRTVVATAAAAAPPKEVAFLQDVRSLFKFISTVCPSGTDWTAVLPIAQLQQGTSDPKPRPRKPSPIPAVVSESGTEAPPPPPPPPPHAEPPADCSAVNIQAPAPPTTAPAPRPASSAWPAPDSPLPPVDWTQTRQRLERLETALRRIPVATVAAAEGAEPAAQIESDEPLTAAAAVAEPRHVGVSPGAQDVDPVQHDEAKPIEMDWSAARQKLRVAAADMNSTRIASGPGSTGDDVPGVAVDPGDGQELTSRRSPPAQPNPTLALTALANTAAPASIVAAPGASTASPTRKQAIRTDWAAAQARIADLQKAKAKALAAAALPARSMYAAAPGSSARTATGAVPATLACGLDQVSESPAKRRRTTSHTLPSHPPDRDERDASIFSQAQAASPLKSNGALFRSPSPAVARSPSPTRTLEKAGAANELLRPKSPSIAIASQRWSSPLTSLVASSETEEDVVMESVEPAEQPAGAATASPTLAAATQQVLTALPAPPPSAAAGLVAPKVEEPAEQHWPLRRQLAQDSAAIETGRVLSHRPPLQANQDRRHWRITPELFDFGLWCKANGLRVR